MEQRDAIATMEWHLLQEFDLGLHLAEGAHCLNWQLSVVELEVSEEHVLVEVDTVVGDLLRSVASLIDLCYRKAIAESREIQAS